MKPERDIYFQKALEEGYLARSAYKLLQIDEVFDIFKGVTKAIDLCSAPGSWTQVIYNKLHGVVNNYDPSRLNPNVKIVSVDMLPMDHFPGVVHLQADISQYSTMKTIIEEFHGEKSDIIVCDGAIDVVGMKLLDYYMHHCIFLSALYIVLNTLKTGGTFVIKIFIDKGHEIFIEKLNLFFQNVCIVKPDCSRNKEVFAVCQDYLPLPGFDSVELTPYVEMKSNDFSILTGVNAEIIPYLCVDAPLINDICITKNFYASKATQDVYNMIDFFLKDSEADKRILRENILKKPLVYQITKDNRLKYNRETEDFVFKDFSKQEDLVRDGDIFGEPFEIDIKCFSNNNPTELSNTKSNNKELAGERLKINTILGEKIKNIELKTKGKFSGLGFNLEDWKFFTTTIHKSDNKINNGLEGIYKDFEEVSKEFESGPNMKRNKYIKSLFMKQEELKGKVRSHMKSEKNEDVS